jgi:hypothetical protein
MVWSPARRFARRVRRVFATMPNSASPSADHEPRSLLGWALRFINPAVGSAPETS